MAEKMMFGDIKVVKGKDKLSIFIDPDHPFLQDLKEIGLRYNPKERAYIVGQTYPKRQELALEKLNAYKDSYQVLIEDGEYGDLLVYRPFQNAGYIVMFVKYDAGLKDKLKEAVPGMIYLGITKTWHIPIESEQYLQRFLKEL